MASSLTDLHSFFYGRLIAASEGTGLKAAGIAVKAADTGRVLMLQRSLHPDDKARGKLEFPGGCLDPGEDAWDAAVREWQEETGQMLPNGRPAGHWTSPNGVYRGFVYIIPKEESVPVGALRSGTVKNPDDPDHAEALIFMDINHLAENPAVRNELRRGTDWNVLAAKPQPSDHEDAQSWQDGVGPNKDRSPLHHGKEGVFTPAPPTSTPGERFPESYVTVNSADGKSSKELKVAVANSPARRSLGLQNIPDLSGVDGLLMQWPADAMGKLHNLNVAVPVSAQYFSSQGLWVDEAHLLPDDPTPFTPKAAHRYVLEVHHEDRDAFGLGPGCSLDMGTDPMSKTSLT